MRLQLTWMVALFFATLQFSFAQKKSISGTVTDESGIPLPGVSVLVKGSAKGTQTDFDGNYQILVEEGKTLVFSYVGMTSAERKVGGSSIINVVLKVDAQELDPVVVTAMGISRKEKSLGYSVSKVDGDDIVRAKDPNIINSLSGKVSGVNITQQSGSVGGSSKIIIRGATSLGGGNQPLFVVDGMPINNDYIDNGIAGAVDYGNSAADINSLDVESLNVLKGAAATALYGARAKNGAIIITTKRGKEGKVSISYNTSVRIDQISKLPDYQNEYAQGTEGVYDFRKFNGWGPEISKVSDKKFKDFLGDNITLKSYPNNVKDFFDTGLLQIHNFSVSGGDTNSDLRLAYTLTKQTGVIPQSSFNKNDISFNVGRNLNDWLNIRLSGAYIRGVRDGLSAQGSNDPNIIVGDIIGMARTTDIWRVKNNVYNKQGKQISWDGEGKVNNPYFILDNNKITSDNERFYGTGIISVSPYEWLTIRNQSGIDFSTEKRRTIWAVGTKGQEKGKFFEGLYRFRTLNNDFIISFDKNITEKIGFNGLVGHNIYQKEYSYYRDSASDLIVPKLYTFGNAKSNVPSNYNSLKRLYGIYAELSFDYDDTLFLTLTGRNDWSSTLPKKHNSYFYPSVSLGYIFSNSFKNKPEWFNFGKLRLNWANVGSDEQPYQIDFDYPAQSTWFSQYGAGGSFPHGGVSAFSIPRVYPNFDLRPQNQVSYEAGVELKLFSNRLTLDATYYYINTEEQIIAIDVPLSTGYFAKKINAGLVNNKGIEVQLGIVPVKNDIFEWDLSFNFSKNNMIVKELDGKLKNYTLTSGWSGLQIKAEPGQPMSIFGTAWKRNEEGEIIINKSNGLREVIAGQNLGKIDPDFRLGISNTFHIKDFTINAVIDWRQGGKMFSGTAAILRSRGLVKETLEHRVGSYVDEGVNEIIDASGNKTYEKNTTPVPSIEKYWGHISSISNTEGNVYDASYMKLREVSIVWNLPKNMLPSSFIKSLSIGLEARNIWNIIDNVPHIDPELNFFGPEAIGGGVEFNSTPLTSSYGLNLKLNF